jgi:uncharacterized membrane protein
VDLDTTTLWWVAALHVAATCAMAGLIWFVQVVHYPLFDRVGPDAFLRYEQAHTSRTTLVVAPTMLVELVTALVLLAALSTSRAAWAGAGLLALVWASTFFVQVPLHRKLSAGWDPRVGSTLVRTNWVRTGGWSARVVCALLMLRAASG